MDEGAGVQSFEYLLGHGSGTCYLVKLVRLARGKHASRHKNSLRHSVGTCILFKFLFRPRFNSYPTTVSVTQVCLMPSLFMPNEPT